MPETSHRVDGTSGPWVTFVTGIANIQNPGGFNRALGDFLREP
jgi:hypothetical protein